MAAQKWLVSVIDPEENETELEFSDYEDIADKAFILNEQFTEALRERMAENDHYGGTEAISSIRDPNETLIENRELYVLLGVTTSGAMVAVLIGALQDGGHALLGFHPPEMVSEEQYPSVFMRSACIMFVERPEGFRTVSVLSQL